MKARSTRRPPKTKHGFWENLPWPGLILLLTGFGLFFNTAWNGYALDDSVVITDNPLVQQGFRGIGRLLTVDTWFSVNLNLGYYRPLSLITFAIEHQLFGNNPAVSHLVNSLLYGLIVAGVYLVLKRLFLRRAGFPFLAALIFATHPIHTEVVANIKSRDELLSCAGVIATLLLLLKSLRNEIPQPLGKTAVTQRRGWVLVASCVTCYLGLLSKETAFATVLLAPLVVYFVTGKSFWESSRYAVLYAAVGGVFLLQKLALTHSLGGAVPDDILNYPYAKLGVKVPAAFMILFTSVRLLVLPHPLRYDYSYNLLPCDGWANAATLGGFAVFVVALLVAVRGIARRTVWGFAAGFSLVAVSPALLFVLLRGGIMAERFLFMPCLGFAVLVTSGILRLTQPHFTQSTESSQPGDADRAGSMTITRTATLVIAFLCVVYATRTVIRNMDWKSNTVLFTADVRTGAASAQNLRHYGDILTYQAFTATDPMRRQEFSQQAMEALKKALTIHPAFGEAYNKLGVNYHLFQTNLDMAIASYRKAIATAPGFPEPYYNLGVAYEEQGNPAAASYFFNRAVKLNPNYAEARQRAEELKAATGLDVHTDPTVDPQPARSPQL